MCLRIEFQLLDSLLILAQTYISVNNTFQGFCEILSIDLAGDNRYSQNFSPELFARFRGSMLYGRNVMKEIWEARQRNSAPRQETAGQPQDA